MIKEGIKDQKKDLQATKINRRFWYKVKTIFILHTI